MKIKNLKLLRTKPESLEFVLIVYFVVCADVCIKNVAIF